MRGHWPGILCMRCLGLLHCLSQGTRPAWEQQEALPRSVGTLGSAWGVTLTWVLVPPLLTLLSRTSVQALPWSLPAETSVEFSGDVPTYLPTVQHVELASNHFTYWKSICKTDCVQTCGRVMFCVVDFFVAKEVDLH